MCVSGEGGQERERERERQTETERDRQREREMKKYALPTISIQRFPNNISMWYPNFIIYCTGTGGGKFITRYKCQLDSYIHIYNIYM